MLDLDAYRCVVGSSIACLCALVYYTVALYLCAVIQIYTVHTYKPKGEQKHIPCQRNSAILCFAIGYLHYSL